MGCYDQKQEYRIQQREVIPFSILNSVFFMLHTLFLLLSPKELYQWPVYLIIEKRQRLIRTGHRFLFYAG